MTITQQEFLDWVENPVTKALKKALHNDREYMKEQLVRGNASDEMEIRGRCNAILSLLNLTYEDLAEGSRDDNKY
jgi:hypothetical protein